MQKVKEENKVSENEKKILEMLEHKKISVDEAYRLLVALRPEEGPAERGQEKGATAKPKAKYLRVTVIPGPGHEDDEDAELVDVRVPMSLIRSGMKFTSVLPPEARETVTGALHEKGIDLDMRNLKPEELEEVIEALSDLEVKVVSKKEVVKVFVEK